MRAPYGLEIIEDCLACPHREDRLFCNLSPPALQTLARITSTASYPKGATLFVEGQEARGVFIICTGRVKLSTASADGKTLILRMADAGEVLGLGSALSGREYQATAELMESAQVNFIPRAEFLEFLGKFGEAALRVAQQLGENYHDIMNEMRTIGLSHSARERLARFILELCGEKGPSEREVRLTLTLTHEEISNVIGVSRETVTRTFSDLKKKQIVAVRGATLIVKDRAALAKLADPAA